MTRGRLLAVAAAAALLALAILAPLQAMPFGREQALFAVAGRCGAAALENPWAANSPGTVAWLAVIGAVFGPLEEDVRVAEMAWLAFACLLAAVVVYELTGGSAVAALLSSALAAIGIAAGGFAGTLRPGELALTPLLLALAAWGDGAEPRRRGQAIAAGLAVGAAGCFTAAAFWAAPALAIAEGLRGGDRRAAARDAAMLGGAALAAPALVLAWALGAGGALSDGAALLVSWFGPWRAPALSSSPPLAWVDGASVAALALLIAAPESLRRTLPTSAALAATAIAAAALGVPGGRPLAFGLLATTAGVAGAAGADWAQRRLGRRWARPLALGACALALLSASPWRSAERQWAIFWRALRGESVFDLASLFADPRAGFSYSAVREAAGVIARAGAPGARLLVWGPEPGLHHYAGLTPAAPALLAAPWAGGPSADAALRALLQTTPPELIAARSGAVPPLEASSAAAALFASYRLAAESNGYRIYRRSDLP